MLYTNSFYIRRYSNIGININDVTVNNLRYADDTVILTRTHDNLQTLLNRIITVSEEYGRSLKSNKVKYMLMTKTHQDIRVMI